MQTVDELGHVRWSAYDADGHVTSTTDPLGAVTQQAYDAAGNQLSAVDPLGRKTTFAYDADNQLVATVYADGSAEASLYDAIGRMTSKVDALGRTTDFAYDALGRLVKVTDALGDVTQYTYNEEGDRLSQVDANQHTTQFPIDVFTGRPTGRVLPDGSSESRSYDAAGEVVKRIDFAGQVTSYMYDGAGRVLSRTYPDGMVVSFTYTPDGQRATATDARGTTTYAYDARRRLTQLTYPDGRALEYGYDAHGDRTSLTAKIGTQSLTTTTGYDASERPNRVQDPLGRTTSVAYDAGGNRTAMAYPNATSTKYAYDSRNRLVQEATQTTGSSPVTIQSYACTLDLAGRRTEVTEADGTVRTYGYDRIDRLTSEAVTGSLTYDKTFGYDGVGNRLTQTTTGAGAATVNYAYDSRDRLTTENATDYAYDPNGNVSSKSGEATYGWDFENRLVSVGVTGGATVAHQYDADGNRVNTSVTPSGGSAVTTNMLVDTAGSLSQAVAETDGSGNVAAVYVRVGDELLEVMRPAAGGTWSTKFIHGDGLESVRTLTDETGTTVDSRGYEAFGTKNVEAGNDPLTYGFAGEPFQADSTLAYHRARWMDARVGRFEGMDPLLWSRRIPMSLHRYLYASVNPVLNTDPSGQIDDIDLAAGAAGEGILATTGEASLVPVGQAIVNEAAASEVTAAVEEAVAEIAAEATTPAAEAAAQNVLTLQGTLRTTATVARQLAGIRNFIPIQGIMAAIAVGSRVADPQGVENFFMYTAEVATTTGQGILEVLVDEGTWTIAHVLYMSQ